MSDENRPGGLAERLPAAVTKRYRPERLLATGGYGDVWLAHQVALSRKVALKVLQADAISDPEELKRFGAEARIAASLSHPNVVIVLDHGVDEGTPWIVYEYVPGRSLREVLDSGALTWPLALDATRQVARGLEAAHAAGVLHRDIKPENVLEARKNFFKVTDFGIAKWSGQDRARTQTGALMGSPSYISPEQITNQPLTPAADVYGLGCMLFELLTGTVPFPATRMATVLNDHLNRPAPLVTQLKPGLPPPLDALVARALAKAPQDRYGSAAEMREAIDLFIGSSDALHLPPLAPEPEDGRRAAGEFVVASHVARAHPDATRAPGAAPDPAAAAGAVRRPAPQPARVSSSRLIGVVLVFAVLGVAATVAVRGRRVAPVGGDVPAPRVERVQLLPDGLSVTLGVGTTRLSQTFPARGDYPRELTFQVPDADGVVQVATATLPAQRVADALAEELEALPAELSRMPGDDRLRKAARDRKKLDEARLRARVEAELSAPLLHLWRLAAAHAGPLLAAELPLPLTARLLARLNQLADLTLKLRSFQLPAPVSMDLAESQHWRIFREAPPGARVVNADVDPGMPLSANGKAMLAELHAAPQAGGMQLPVHLVCATTDLAGRTVGRDRAQQQLGTLLRDWVSLGFLTVPAFPVDSVSFEEVLPFRLRATVSLPQQDGTAFIGAAMRPRLLATLRVTVNGQVTVRLAQLEAIDPSFTGGITIYHGVDPRVLKQGPNELLVEAVSLNAGADEPPWTGFDSLFVGMTQAAPAPPKSR